MFVLFLQNLPRGFSEIWKKVWGGGYLKETLIIQQNPRKMCHPQAKFSAVVGDGTMATESWMLRHTVSGPQREQCCFSGKECKFPAAANSCGTKKTILRNWNSIISIHSFLSSGVCENTLRVSVQHTHTHMHTLVQGGEKPLNVPAFASVLGNMQVWLNQVWECFG